MKRFILFSFLVLGLVISSMAQKSDKKQNLPRENSKVTREYDEKGNLIKFDSIYSYSYSSDSTLLKNLSPNSFPGFSFFNDSVFKGNSFFDDFDKMFAEPFISKDFDDLFGHFFESEKDSSSVKKQDKIAGKSQPQSMNEVMQKFRKQVQEMEKMQREFFEENQKFKEF